MIDRRRKGTERYKQIRNQAMEGEDVGVNGIGRRIERGRDREIKDKDI